MPDRRRLLLVTSETFPPPYRSLREIYGRLLPQMGYEVGLVFTDADTPGQRKDSWHPPGHLTRISSTRGMLAGGLVAGQLRRWQQTAHLTSEVERGQWDLVQVRDDPWLGTLFARACGRSKTPLVFQLSHLKEEELLLRADRGLYGNPLLNRAKARFALRMRGRVMRSSSAVLPISAEMLRYLTAHRVTTPMESLPEGVPSSLIDSKPDPAPVRRRLEIGDRPVMMYVGTLSRMRELEFLFPVLRRVQVTFSSAQLVYAGEGPDPADRRFLEEKAKAEGVARSTHFTGPIDLDAIPMHIAAADVGLSPLPPISVFQMNSPIKLMEYLALGVPVVASQTPEQSDLLNRSQGGFAVPHTVADFADAIVRLLKNPQQARRRGAAGRELIRRERTFEVLVERLDSLYSRLAAAAGRASRSSSR